MNFLQQILSGRIKPPSPRSGGLKHRAKVRLDFTTTIEVEAIHRNNVHVLLADGSRVVLTVGEPLEIHSAFEFARRQF